MALSQNAAYRRERMARSATAQRVLLLGGGGLYAMIGFWVGLRANTPALLTSSTVVAFLTFALLGLTFFRDSRARLEGVPVLAALLFGLHTGIALAAIEDGGGPGFAILFTLLALYVVALAPALYGAAASLLVTLAVGTAVNLLVAPATASGLSSAESFLFWLPGMALAAYFAWDLERARQKAFTLNLELERRATSDDLTGVSNRAHINLLAQNEFSRARRYREPYSCLMFEIDGFETFREKYGAYAAEVVLQVFCGYCVVVMRHCDSFGRLGPHRFLALLPETEGLGAVTLSKRMCRDLSALSVHADGRSLNFTVSIGAADMHPTDRWAGDMLRRAEQALDDAIESGRNTAVLAEMPPEIPGEGLDMATPQTIGNNPGPPQ